MAEQIEIDVPGSLMGLYDTMNRDDGAVWAYSVAMPHGGERLDYGIKSGYVVLTPVYSCRGRKMIWE